MYKLTPQQKALLERLTDKINKRIMRAEIKFREAGLDILPYDIAGQYQVREQWETKSKPLSRSTRFATEEEYRARIRHLRELEELQTTSEYAKVGRVKLNIALETSLGFGVPPQVKQKLDRMSATELGIFWKIYSEKAARMGLRYSSQQAMIESLEDFYGEDINYLLEG